MSTPRFSKSLRYLCVCVVFPILDAVDAHDKFVNCV